MKEKGLMSELIGEVFGTFILILLGDGVVANVGLAPVLQRQLITGTRLPSAGVLRLWIAVYVSGGVSGAHLNPAVTLGLASGRGFPWSKVVPFIVAQMVGAFLGALAVYLIYRDGLVAAGMPNVWSTGPGSVFGASFWGGEGAAATGTYSMVTASIAELFGTFVLLWGILASGDSKNMGLKDNLARCWLASPFWRLASHLAAQAATRSTLPVTSALHLRSVGWNQGPVRRSVLADPACSDPRDCRPDWCGTV
jgi:glycerol uptake facilitator protein